MQLLVTAKLYETAESMSAMLFPDCGESQNRCRDSVLRALNHDPLPGEFAAPRPGTRLVVV